MEHERSETHTQCEATRAHADRAQMRENEAVESAYTDAEERLGFSVADSDVQGVPRLRMQFHGLTPPPGDDSYSSATNDPPLIDFQSGAEEDQRILDKLEEWGQYLSDKVNPQELLLEDQETVVEDDDLESVAGECQCHSKAVAVMELTNGIRHDG
jgi:hypothetical protein